jgi:hypothetical protein
MLSRRRNDHGPGTQRRVVACGFNGQSGAPGKNLYEPALSIGCLVKEHDHGRADVGRQSAQHLRYRGKTAS